MIYDRKRKEIRWKTKKALYILNKWYIQFVDHRETYCTSASQKQTNYENTYMLSRTTQTCGQFILHKCVVTELGLSSFDCLTIII